MKVLSYNFSGNWLQVIELYKYESLRIMLTWNNAPSVSYCGPFLSSSEAGSTDHPRQLYQAATWHPHSVRRELLACGSALNMYHLSIALSVEFANADIPRKCIIGSMLITNLIIGASGLELSSYPTVGRH